MIYRLVFSVSVVVFSLLGGHAGAHTGLTFDFGSGVQHPVTGIDHLLAMFAVGLFAAQLGGHAVVLVPGAFVATMVVGASAGMAAFPLPGVEHAIAVSIAAIALPVAFAVGMPAPTAMAYVAVFAIFHGYAHGAELPAPAHAWSYVAGFACTTVLIHAAGVAAGLMTGQFTEPGRGLQLAGGAVAIAGLPVALA